MNNRTSPARTVDQAVPASGLLVALFLMSIYAATLMLVTGGFLVRVEAISRWSFVLALAANVCLLPLAAKWLGVSLRRMATALTGALLVYAVCCLLAAFFFDITHDGQTYHAQAILAMADGWNPAYDTLPAEVPNTLWVQRYGKGYEYVAYGICTLTGSLESGKGLNGVLIVASALILHSATLPFLQSISTWRRRALLALAVLNPISVFMLFTFLVDGQLASCLLILLATAEIFRRNARAGGVLLFSALLILAQLKFTALVYGALATAGAGAFLLFFDRRRLPSFILVSALAGIVAVGWVGYNPYVRNFSEKGHPFYPLMGEGSISIMGGANSPPSFEHKSRVRKLAEATFARSRNVHGAALAPEPVLKVPFTFDIKEWTVFKGHDVRMGGFGPLWSGALLLSLVAAALVVYGLRSARRELGLFAGGSVLLLTLTLINPECWSARYVPQLWWLPLWIAAFAFRCRGRLTHAVASGTLLALAINLAGVSAVSVASDAILTSELRNQFRWLERQSKPVKIPPHVFVANDARMKHRGIQSLSVRAEADTTALLATGHQSLTLQNSQTKVFYQGAPYQPTPLFARLAQYINAGKNEH